MPTSNRLHRSGLAAALAVSAVAGVTPALASPGCDGVNSNFISGSVGGGGSTYSGLVSNFAAGDVVTLTVTRATAGSGTFRLTDAAGKNVFVDAQKGAVVQISYAVRGTSDTTLTAIIVSGGAQIAISGVCRSGIPASGMARALQIQLTPMVALTSGAAITGAVDGAIADAFASSVSPFSGGAGFMRMSLVPDADRPPEAFNALGYVDRGRRPPAPERNWSVWIDARGTRWNDNSSAADLRSDQINVTAGIGRKLGPDVLVGLFMGYENFKYDVNALDSTLKGSGWTSGAYAAWRMTSQIRFDAMLAYSGVNYDVNASTAPGAINGTATGTFTGGRWLGSAGVTGVYPSNGFVLEPSMRVFALWEQQKQWTDSTGQDQAARSFTVGKASTGAKLSYPLPGTPNLTVTPYAGAYGDYRFSKDDAVPVAIASLGVKDGLSGRTIAGVLLANRTGSTLAVGGEVAGLGQIGQQLWTLTARGSVPF